jgi:uncharacterized protein
MKELSVKRAAAVLLTATVGLGPAVSFAQKKADLPPAAGAPGEARTVTWEELVPKGWDPFKDFRGGEKASLIGEGSAKEAEMMKQMRDIWDTAPVRDELNGQRIRLPGYVVPLDGSGAGGTLKEFLLVPYFGACIHTPPPPANQIVHVTLKKPMKMRTMDVVWISGEVSTQRKNSDMGMSGYAMRVDKVEPYQIPGR